MTKHKQAEANDLGTLAEDARALMAATADVAGDKVAEARQRLATALENGKELVGRAREKAVERVRAVEQVAREHHGQTIAIAFGVGAVVGLLLARRGRA
ncbi:MAG: DUF883 family protein [Verrucomicrobia bacterium]|nr:DUF883 family protein [Verrucomicrobiota bacterium]